MRVTLKGNPESSIKLMKLELGITFKFLIPLLVAFSAITIFLAVKMSNIVKEIAIQQASSLIVDFVQNQAARHIDSSERFSLNDSPKTEDTFSELFEEVKVRDVVRIKVWDTKGMVVFSDDKSIVGKNFADNHEFQEAIKGETEVEIKEPLKEENASEKGYRQLMEVYVPITLPGGASPAGVVETYYKMDVLNEDIRQAQIKIVAIIGLAFTVLAAGIWVGFRIIILEPLSKLESEILEIKQEES